MSAGADPAVSASAGPAGRPEQGKLMGRWMATSLVVGNMIGSGIFLLPSSLAPLGWNAVAGWVLTIGGGLVMAATFAWLARTIPVAGGPHAYTRAAFGPLAAFVVSWSYWISLWIGNAAIATAGVSYLGAFFPQLGGVTGGDALAAVVAIWALTWLNLRGTRSAGRFQLATTLVKVLPLVAVVVLAVLALASGEAQVRPLPAGEMQPGLVTAAATLTLWALLGLESATVPAGRIKDPEKTVPFATLVGTALTGLLYLVTCSTVTLLLPAEMIAGSGAPFAVFVAHFWSPGPALLIAGFAAISCFGALNGWILVQGEMPAAMARGGGLPRWFAGENAHGVPARSLLLSSALMTVVMLMNYQGSAAEIFAFLMLLGTACALFMYLVCMAAALRLRLGAGHPAGSWLVPVAALGVVYAAWTIYGAGGEAVAWGLVLLAASLPAYWLFGRITAREAASGG